MKFKVGDRVKVKNLDWYSKNRDESDEVPCKENTFVKSMTPYCDSILTIENKTENGYQVKENTFWWTDEMIEGLVEEETKFGTASNPLEPKSNAYCSTREMVDELVEEEVFIKANDIYNEEYSKGEYCHEQSFKWGFQEGYNYSHENDKLEISLKEGYQFKDENGNVINATKIVLEKKKKEYPKTYEECCNVLEYIPLAEDVIGYKWDILQSLQTLLICRDAYWKIAGEEMGLDKPWSPTDSDYITGRYCIFVHKGNIICSTPAEDCPFTFPTEEMRDAFYENFKELIEQCKELL